jgi:hypothetical protein
MLWNQPIGLSFVQLLLRGQFGWLRLPRFQNDEVGEGGFWLENWKEGAIAYGKIPAIALSRTVIWLFLANPQESHSITKHFSGYSMVDLFLPRSSGAWKSWLFKAGMKSDLCAWSRRQKCTRIELAVRPPQGEKRSLKVPVAGDGLAIANPSRHTQWSKNLTTRIRESVKKTDGNGC